MNNIYNYSLNELEEYFVSIGEKKFRATQIFEWLYRMRINSFDEMTNISQKTILHMKENFYIERLKIVTK